MVTVFVVLILIALIATVASAMGKAPLWIGVVFLCIIEGLKRFCGMLRIAQNITKIEGGQIYEKV